MILIKTEWFLGMLSFNLDPNSIPSKNRPKKKIEVMDLVVTSALASALCHSSFWQGKRKARELKFCQYVCIRGRFQET